MNNRGNYQFNNNFNGGNNANGGGFIQDSPAPNSPKGGDGKNRSNQSLMPVTVRQVHRAMTPGTGGEDAFTIDGRDINQLSLVGVILQPNQQSTNFSFQLDDGTGWIDVRIWEQTDDSNNSNDYAKQKQARWTEGTYVRVIGHLRSFNNKRSIVAFRVIPIENFNEITYHQLEAIYVHLFNHNGPPGGNQSQLGGSFFQPHQNYYNSNSNSMARGGGWTDVQRAVHSSFTECRDENGLSIIDVVRRLQGTFNEGDIRAAIGFLSGEGHLFSTIDDDHYKAT